MKDATEGRRTWPYAIAGALLFFALVVAVYAGDEEGSDPIVFLGGFAAVVGALLGTLLGGMINAKRSRR